MIGKLKYLKNFSSKLSQIVAMLLFLTNKRIATNKKFLLK